MRSLSPTIPLDIVCRLKSVGDCRGLEERDSVRVESSVETMRVVCKRFTGPNIDLYVLEGAVLDTAATGLSNHERPAVGDGLNFDIWPVATKSVVRIVYGPVI